MHSAYNTATVRIVSPLDHAEQFEVNGITSFAHVAPLDFLERAHAVIGLLGTYAAEDGGVDKMVVNPEIVAGCIAATETLIELGMLAIHNQQAGSC